jgi:hypothetical protein
MYDTVVFRHFTVHGGPLPDVREALAQRLHDAGIDGALGAVLTGGRPAHGARGRHRRDWVDTRYGGASRRTGMAADLAQQLRGPAGPGRRPAADPGSWRRPNLGAYLARRRRPS